MSNIDVTVPIQGTDNPSQKLRDNWTITANEIDGLDARLTLLEGGGLTAPLVVMGANTPIGVVDPTNTDPANYKYGSAGMWIDDNGWMQIGCLNADGSIYQPVPGAIYEYLTFDPMNDLFSVDGSMLCYGFVMDTQGFGNNRALALIDDTQFHGGMGFYLRTDGLLTITATDLKGNGSLFNDLVYFSDFGNTALPGIMYVCGRADIAGPLHVTGPVGFNGATPPTKPAVTGSRGGNAALASLITALASYGLVTDSTTA